MTKQHLRKYFFNLKIGLAQPEDNELWQQFKQSQCHKNNKTNKWVVKQLKKKKSGYSFLKPSTVCISKINLSVNKTCCHSFKS